MREKRTRDELLALLKASMSYLRSEYGVERLALFGSVVSGEFRPESDVDILVEFSVPVGFRFNRLADELEKLLGRRVDLMTPAGLRSLRVQEIADSIRENLLYV
jgi:predicted nucleotidyltransferase